MLAAEGVPFLLATVAQKILLYRDRCDGSSRTERSTRVDACCRRRMQSAARCGERCAANAALFRSCSFSLLKPKLY